MLLCQNIQTSENYDPSHFFFLTRRQTGQVVQSTGDTDKVLTSATGISALPQVLPKFSSQGRSFHVSPQKKP